MISPLLFSPSLLLPAAFLHHTVGAWQRVVRRDRTARCVRRRGAVLARVHRRFQGRATSRRRGGPRQRLGLRSETSHRRGPGDGTYIHRGDHQARWRSTWPSVPTLRVPLAQCAGDVPAPDVTVVTDEADDFTAMPTVTHQGDVSDGLSCPETITRTYRVTDVCGNFIDVQQLIVIMDTQAPVMDPPPAAATVQCVGDIPAPTMLGYTDNCDAPGTVLSVDGPLVGGGCGGTVTRTWTATDICGNISAAVTQTFTVMDNIPPKTKAIIIK